MATRQTLTSSFTVRYAAEGVGVASTTKYYALSTSATEVTGTWSTTCPTMTADYPYLWEYTVTMYTDGGKDTTDPVLIGHYGQDGATGATGADGEDGPAYTFSPASIALTALTDDDGNPTGDFDTFTLTVNGTDTASSLMAFDNTGSQVSISSYSVVASKNCTYSKSSTKLVITASTRDVEYTTADDTTYTYSLAYSSGYVILDIVIGDDTFTHTVAWNGDVSLVTGGFNATKSMLSSVYSAVTENTANISSLTQTAEQIQSTVTAIATSEGGNNLFANALLNFVSKRYVASSSYSPLSAELTSGKMYTLTVKARLSETFTTTNAALRVYLYGGCTSSTTYLYFTSTDYVTQSITFTATSDATTYLYLYMGTYSSSGTWSSLSSSAISYVQIWRAQLEEGDSFSGWDIADGEDEVKANMLSTTLSDLVDSDTYTITENETIETSGETVALDYATIGSAATFLTASIAAGDMLPSRTYTLSFYSKCSSADTITAALYRSTSSTNYNVDGGVAADGSLIEYTSTYGYSGTGDGSTEITLTTSWVRYQVRWTMWPSSNVSNYLHTLTLTSANGDAMIAGIKLEQNGVATSYFSASALTSYMYSQITQTASEITATVTDGLKSTGIDITNGVISVMADQFFITDSDGNTTMSVNEFGGIAFVTTDFASHQVTTTIAGNGLTILDQGTGSKIFLGFIACEPVFYGIGSDGSYYWDINEIASSGNSITAEIASGECSITSTIASFEVTVNVTNGSVGSVILSSTNCTCYVTSATGDTTSLVQLTLSSSITVAVGSTGTLTFTGTETDSKKFANNTGSVDVYFKYSGTTIATATIDIE